MIPPAHAFDDGTGTEADPWQIATKEQLALLSHIYQNYSDYYRQYFYEQNPYFVLTKDIILNEIDHPKDFNTLSEAFLWEPIGNSSNSFCDHFDGAGHTIRGVVIVTDATNIPYNDITAQGLFGTVGHGAVIKNDRLEACYMKAIYSVHEFGMLAGTVTDANIENCSVNGIIDLSIEYGLSVSVGGVAGNVKGGSLTNCSFAGEIRHQGKDGKIGGIVGRATGIDLTDCRNTGDIMADAPDYMGGIAAFLEPGPNSRNLPGEFDLHQIRYMLNCSNEGDLQARAGGYVGGLAGGLYISNNQMYFEGPEGKLSDAQFVDELHLAVISSENKGNLVAALSSGIGGLGGLFGTIESNNTNSASNILVKECINTGIVAGTGGNAGVGGIVGMIYCTCSWSLENCTNKGSITAVEKAAGIAADCRPCRYSCQIYGCFNEGEIASLDGGAGGIIAEYSGFSFTVSEEKTAPFIVEKCENRGKINSGGSTSASGGIVGQISYSINSIIIRQCLNAGSIQGKEHCRLGGILGSSQFGDWKSIAYPGFIVEKCVNRATLIHGDGCQIFQQEDKMQMSVPVLSGINNHFNVLSGTYIGGLVGYNRKGIVQNSVNLGEIRIDAESSFILEYNKGSASVNDDVNAPAFCGAVCGLFFYAEEEGSNAENSKIESCYYSNSSPLGVYAPYEDENIHVIALDESNLDNKAEEMLR